MSGSDLPDITITGKPGQTVKVYTTLSDGTPIGNKQTGVTKARNRRTLTLDGTYVPDPDPPPPPPPPPTTSRVLGPAVASDGRGNLPVGRSVDSCFATRWGSQGGEIVNIWFNQKFGPNQSSAGSGYSRGSGGKVRISLQGVANGIPDGHVWAERQYTPGNPALGGSVGVEVRTPIQFLATIPKGDYCLVWESVDADPTNNWMSLNCLYNPSSKQPGTDAAALWKDDQSVSSGWGTGGRWEVKGDHTPTFQVEYRDGHFEGQGYAGIIANTNIDGDNMGSGFALSGNRRLRQRLVAPGVIKVAAVWLRVKNLSGPGLLYATIGSFTGSTSISGVPVTSKGDLNGGAWVRVPLVVSLPAGSFNVDFGTDGIVDVMPIRKDGLEVSGWKVPQNGAVFADKSFDGGATWAPVYSTGTDLQMYLETA